MECIRRDVYHKWGKPEVEKPDAALAQRLGDIMLPWEAVHHLAVDEDAHEVVWGQNVENWETDWMRGEPVIVGAVDGGGWNKNVYAGCVPATKASSFGLAGHTQLVAQRDVLGNWRARTLDIREVLRMFEAEGVTLVVSEDAETALTQLGNAGPAKMVLPYAEALVSFCKPPAPFIPQRMDEIIAERDIRAFRGTMHLAHRDYQIMKDRG